MLGYNQKSITTKSKHAFESEQYCFIFDAKALNPNFRSTANSSKTELYKVDFHSSTKMNTWVPRFDDGIFKTLAI